MDYNLPYHKAGPNEYEKEIEVKLPLTIKAATFKDGRGLGKVSYRTIVILKE